MQLQDERVLIARIGAGDEQAMHLLYTTFRPRLWRYLWQQLDGDGSAVEDVLQEVFLAIWRSAESFRNEAGVNTWIFRIAHYQVLHRRRDAARRPEGHLTALQDEESDGADLASSCAEGECSESHIPHKESHEDEVIDRLTMAATLDRLAAKHREALELVFQEGFTLEEVARILDVPVGTVKSRISYARRALQQELARALPLEDERT
jgi:RNA polymerase sigma-70 factor, ECF subfamily